MKRNAKKTPEPGPTPRDEVGIPVFRTGNEFDALSDADKEKVWQYYNRVIPESELLDSTPEEPENPERPN